MLVAVPDAVNAIGDAGHSSYCELVPGHFLVAELVEELAALAQGSHSSAEPYRSHPDTQVGTAALHSSKLGYGPLAGSLAEIRLVVAVPMSSGDFAFAVQALETLVAVAMMSVEMAAVEPLLADSYSQLARLVAVMTSKLRLHRYWLMGGMPSYAIQSFPCRRDH